MSGRAGLVGAVAALGLAVLAPAASAAIVSAPDVPEGAVLGVHGEYRFTSDSTNALGRPDASMRVVGPGDPPLVLAGGPDDRGFSTVVLNTLCPAEPCAVAPNGPYRAVEEKFGGGGQTRTFFLRIGGQRVADLAAELEARAVTVTWRPGPERDVTGWSVQDDQGAMLQVKPDACGEGVCSATFAYPPTTSGTRTFSVRAARPCGVEECGDVLGPAATVAAQLPPAATSQPGPGQSGPGSTVGPAPGATGGTGTAQRPSSLGGFTAFGPKLGQPKLPPMPDNVPPAVAAPLPDTFDPTLDYGQQPEVADGELVPEAAAGRDGTRLSSTGGMLGDEQVMRGVAGALVLMMSGAHLRAWLGKLREDPLGL